MRGTIPSRTIASGLRKSGLFLNLLSLRWKPTLSKMSGQDLISRLLKSSSWNLHAQALQVSRLPRSNAIFQRLKLLFLHLFNDLRQRSIQNPLAALLLLSQWPPQAEILLAYAPGRTRTITLRLSFTGALLPSCPRAQVSCPRPKVSCPRTSSS